MPIVSESIQCNVPSVAGKHTKEIIDTVQSLQESLINNAEGFLHGESLPQIIKDAFTETPRHVFSPRFQDGAPGLWADVQDDILLQHLNTLYADQPYCIYKDDDGETIATISQPSLVLFMLYLLDLNPGFRVFELGGGSGWNAALMGRLVGDRGHITSIEIIPSLVTNARKALSLLDIRNVSLISGDAYSEVTNLKPFDRGVFTASAWDLPSFFFDKIKDGGLLLFVFKINSASDLLILLRKTNGHFVSETHFPCRFVPITRDTLPNEQQIPSIEEAAFSQELDSRGIDIEDVDLKVCPNRETSRTGPSDYAFSRGESSFVWTFPK